MTGRKYPKPANEHEYLVLIEKLAREVISEAIREKSFEVFLDEGDKTALQHAVSELARNIRYQHSSVDGCDVADD